MINKPYFPRVAQLPADSMIIEKGGGLRYFLVPGYALSLSVSALADRAGRGALGDAVGRGADFGHDAEGGDSADIIWYVGDGYCMVAPSWLTRTLSPEWITAAW